MYKNLLDIRGHWETDRASEVCVKSGQKGDIHICEPGRRRTKFYWTSVAERGREERVMV